MFATEAEATTAARELMSRWMAMDDFKVVPMDKEPNYRFDQGGGPGRSVEIVAEPGPGYESVKDFLRTFDRDP